MLNNLPAIYGGIKLVSYSEVVLADNPIGFWLLNEASGSTATDSSTSSINATYNNTPTLNQTGPSGAISKSVFFDGASSENAVTALSSTYAINAGSNWSMDIWFKDNSTVVSSIETFFTWRGDVSYARDVLGLFTLNNGSAGRIQILSSTNTGFDGDTLVLGYDRSPDTNWHHVAATAVSGGALKLYLDGAEVASTTTARWTGTNVNKRAVIGSNWNTSTGIQYLTGNLAAGAVYNTTLSASRVLAHYNAGV
jgi:hypothetical protein